MTEPSHLPWIWAHQKHGHSADDDLVIAARSILAARRAMVRSLPPGFVHDPAIEILFSLYVEHARGRRSTMAELAARLPIAAGIVRRWVGALAQEGLLRVRTVMGDADVIELTDRGWADLSSTARAVIRSQVSIQDENGDGDPRGDGGG